MRLRLTFGVLSLATVLALTTGCGSSSSDKKTGETNTTTAFTQVKNMTADEKQKQIKAVLSSYSDIALDAYTKSVTDATALQGAINAFIADPTDTTLSSAKTAWKTSRESYGPTEIFRLSEGPIDAEGSWVEDAYGALEGQINAWPLDENMIDYTTNADGEQTTGNIIDTAGSFTPSGDGATAVDITTITVAAITALNENGGEANVATGYHAIEFLLWGQDQDYASMINDNITHGEKKAGERPISDYTTDGNAQRRKDFLKASADKLVADLEAVASAWNTTLDGDNGKYRKALLGELTGTDASKNINSSTALKTIMAGMGVFIKSELANERMAVAVLTPSEEDEHSCFSDNTHRDIDLNYRGFVNALKGEYNSKSYGTSIYSLLSSAEQKILDDKIASIDLKVTQIDKQAREVEHFDYQIKEGSVNRQNIRDAKNEMRSLGDEIIKVASEFGITLNSDDVTDSEETQL